MKKIIAFQMIGAFCLSFVAVGAFASYDCSENDPDSFNFETNINEAKWYGFKKRTLANNFWQTYILLVLDVPWYESVVSHSDDSVLSSQSQVWQRYCSWSSGGDPPLTWPRADVEASAEGVATVESVGGFTTRFAISTSQFVANTNSGGIAGNLVGEHRAVKSETIVGLASSIGISLTGPSVTYQWQQSGTGDQAFLNSSFPSSTASNGGHFQEIYRDASLNYARSSVELRGFEEWGWNSTGGVAYFSHP